MGEAGSEGRWGGTRARRWGLVLAGLAVLALTLFAGQLLSRPEPRPGGASGDLDRLLTLLAELESAERGYVLGGREEEAAAHAALAAQIDAMLPQVVGPAARLGPDGPRSALESLLAELLAASRETVRLRRERGPTPADAAKPAHQVVLAFDRLRTVLRELTAEQRARLEAREAELATELRRRTAIAAAAGLAGLLAAVLAFAGASRRRRAVEFVDMGGRPELVGLEAAGRAGEILRTVLETVDDAVVVVDEHGRSLVTNAAAEAALGLGASRAGADNFGLYLADGGGTQKGSPILRALKGETLRGATFFMGPAAKEGSRCVTVNARAVRGGPTRLPQGAVIVLRDVTEQRRAEAARRESEERLGRVIENAPFGVVTLGPEGRIRGVNPGFCRLLGYDAQVLMGRDTRGFTHRLDIEREAPLLREVLSGARASYEIEKRCRTSEDVTRWLRWTVSAIRDQEGAVVSALATVDDVTERRRLEWTARRSQELLRNVLDALPVGVWVVDRKGSVQLSNPAGRRIWPNAGDILRFPEGEYKGFWAETGKRVEPHEWGALPTLETGKASLDKLIRVQRYDGTSRMLVTSCFPFRGASGQVGGAVVVTQDVTKDGWTSEQRLRLEAELHQAILQTNTLRGLLPLCPLCEKRREDPAYWKRVQAWLGEHMAEMREHACRECQSRAYDLSGHALESKPASKA